MVTLEKSLDLLFLFGADRPVLTVPEMATALAVPASTLYRYVRTFRERGLLEEDQGTPFGYRLGPRVLDLARVYGQTSDLGRLSRPIMAELSDTTGETVLLTVVRNLSAYCVAVVESRRSLRLSFQVGDPLPLHAGASTKVLLAYVDEADFQAVVSRGLTRYTAATVTDPVRLKGQMEEIRRRGWAFSDGEVDEWARGLAVPVRNSRGSVVAALSVAGPSQRLPDSRLPELVVRLKEAADRLSALIF